MVRRYANLTPHQFDEIIREGEPVVIDGVASKWPALQLWDADYLERVSGDREVGVHVFKSADYLGGWRGRAYPALRTMRFREAVRHIRSEGESAERYYMVESMEGRLPELCCDVGVPFFINRTVRSYLFFGDSAATPLHFHPFTQVCLGQIRGTKRIRLYRPRLRERFDHRSVVDPFFHSADAQSPDFESIPPDFEYELQPGEVFFFPIHWWHLVESRGFNAAVQFSWTAEARDWTLSAPGVRSAARKVLERLPLGGLIRPAPDGRAG